METFEKETIATLNSKVVIPTLLLNDMIAWYHENLQHPGITRTYKTISSHFYYTNLEKYIGLFIKKCFICTKEQKNLQNIMGIYLQLKMFMSPWNVYKSTLLAHGLTLILLGKPFLKSCYHARCYSTLV